MEQDPQTFRLAPVLRHLAGILCLLAAWKFLSLSDDSARLAYHITFVIFLLISVLLLFFPLLIHAFSNISLTKAALLGALFVLILPWGEWFSLTTQTAREHWGKILLFQVLFLYSAHLLFTVSPATRNALDQLLHKTTNFLARKYFGLLLPVLFFLFCACLSVFLYQETPIVTDAAAYLFQAKIFSRFQADAPAPALTDFFTFSGDQIIIRNGRWFGMNFPGFSMLLVPWLAIGAGWILNPLLGAITCGIWISYTKRWYGEKQAVLIGILMLLSPFLIAIHSNFVVNAAELTIVSAILYISRNVAESSGGRLIVFMLPLMVVGVLVRFFSMMSFLLPVILYTCYCEWRRKSVRFTITTLTGLIIGIGLLLLYQWRLTGDPFVVPYVLEQSGQRLGFGAAAPEQVHTLARALENLSDSILALDFWVSGLFSGSIIFLAICILKTSKSQTWDRIFLLSAMGLSIFYLFYFFQDLSFGPRYYVSLAPILLLFTVRTVFEDNGETRASRSSVAALLILSLLVSVPVRLPGILNKFDPATTIAGNLKNALEKQQDQKILLFIDKRTRQQFVSWNEPFLDGPVIICRDLGEKNEQIMATFPEFRPLYYKKNEDFESTPLFQIDTQPSNRSAGAFSFFRLVKSIIAAQDYPERDCVDIVYEELLYGDSALLQLEFLERELSKGVADTRFNPDFRKGILHIGRVFLLPRVTEELHGESWLEKLDTHRIKREMQLALNFFVASGEVGKPVVEQIQKMERRMNANNDAELSDEELRRYFSAKVRLVTSW